MVNDASELTVVITGRVYPRMEIHIHWSGGLEGACAHLTHHQQKQGDRNDHLSPHYNPHREVTHTYTCGADCQTRVSGVQRLGWSRYQTGCLISDRTSGEAIEFGKAA